MCGSKRSDDCGRASLLPHDEESMRTDGNAGLARLLQESSTLCPRQCFEDRCGVVSSRRIRDTLGFLVRPSSSTSSNPRLAPTPETLTPKASALDHFLSKSLVRSYLAKDSSRASACAHV